MESRLSIINPRPRKLSGPPCLHDLVAGKDSSDNIAIEYHDFKGDGIQITYKELHNKADDLASIITQASRHSNKPDHFIIPLLLPQCAELYITQLAILKAGGAFCPLPIDAPEDRLRFILNDVSASVVLTTSKLRSKIPQSSDITIIEVDKLNDAAPEQQHRTTTTNDLAYVMYTSGSTGLPKGVLLSHSAAVQALLAHDRHIPAYSRFLQFAAPTFDVSVFEIFFTLFHGRTIICCERTHLLSDLPGTINALNIDAAELTPSVASNLLGPRDAVPGLKVLLTIGEMLKKDVIERYGGSSDREAILQGMYGPTEATIHCTLQADCQRDMTPGNIGTPLDTVSAFIVRPVSESDGTEPSIEILPLGAEGELAVGGFQLANGYLNRDEQTTAAFFSHPEHGRLYRTGDKAIMTEDGLIRCLGRISSGQVKLRGQRMELGEVEYAVAKTSGCTGAVAEIISDVLVAFCHCNVDEVSSDDFKNSCKKWLPAYMLPTEYMLLSTLPYLASGKIDRRALRNKYEKERSGQGTTTIHSKDEQVKSLIEIIHGILGQTAVKGEELALPGIDSLSSIRIASALNKKGYKPPMATHIMSARTIYDLSDIVTDAQTSNRTSTNSASKLLFNKRREEALLDPLIRQLSSKIEKVLPCSAVQAAMLSATAVIPQRYCNWIRLGINSAIEDNRIQEALVALIAEHELLRAGFLTGNAGFDLIIFSHASHDQIRWVSELSFDYEVTTEQDFLAPTTFQLVRTQDSVNVLIRSHHALYDQWTIDILKHDLSNLLKAKSVQAVPFSRVLEHYIDNVEQDMSEESLDFWNTLVSTADPTIFPNTNSIREESLQHRTAWTPMDIDNTLLHRSTAERGCNAQSIFQSAFAYLVSQYVGTTDVVYGTVLSGRHIAVPGIDRIFGPTLTTLPSRSDLSNGSKWSEVIEATHKLNRKILEHSAMPMTQIKRLTGLAPDEPLFDTLFVWQDSTLTQDDEQVVREIDSADYHEFKVAIEVRPRPHGFEARLTHDRSIVPEQQAQQLLLQVEAVVNVMLDNPEITIEDTHQHLAQALLSVSNPEPIEAAAFNLVYDLEQAGSAYPELPAVMFADSFNSGCQFQSISFEELHKRANQLAHHLYEIGVKPGDLVCICMEKSVDFYVAILGVIKTGAGYLPLVPEIQPQRAISIFEQAQVKAVIADEISNGIANLAQVVTLSLKSLSHDLPSTPLGANSNPSDIAYTVFTSGSTGVPKGVAVTRQNLHGNLKVLQQMYEHQPGDRLLQACLQSFDVAVFEIFFSFLTCMTICTAARDTLFYDLPRSIRQFGITHLSMTPTVAGLVTPAEVPTVKFLVTAGEAITPAVHRAWAGKGLHQGYGPSETTNICTVNMSMTPEHHLGSIGAPFSNTSAFVLAPAGVFNILPQGAYGEFAFGGEQVFRGYLGLNKLNQEKIHEHPRYGRVYRSGDLGRILADGTLLIHGRSDFQVKIRGNRVELGEINTLILRHDGAEDCFTIAYDDSKSTPLLISFWKPHGDHYQDSRVLEADNSILEHNGMIFRSLEASLPSYMLPSFIFPISRLPRTAQGKIDLRALQSLYKTCSKATRLQYSRTVASDEEDQAPVPGEDVIINALGEMFDITDADIDRKANFEVFGLNSVNAISLARSLTKKTGEQVQVSMILRNASVSRLSRALYGRQSEKTDKQEVALHVFTQHAVEQILKNVSVDMQQVEAVLPCTPLQEAMLVAGLGQEHAFANNTVFHVVGNIDNLKESLRRVFERQAILRTVFAATELKERPFAQIVLKAKPLPWIDQTPSTHCLQAIVSPRDPVRIIAQPDEKGIRLQLQMHHAVYDGTSMAIMLSEIEALYHQKHLPPAPSAVDFLSECIKQAGSEAHEYWSQKFTGFQPRPFLHSKELNTAETQHSLSLNKGVKDFQPLLKQHHVSIASIFQAAWAKCLAYLTDDRDICFGEVASGRMPHIDNIDALVAPCFNTIPIRVNFTQNLDNIQLVQRIQRLRDMSQRCQLTPLRMIQRFSSQPAARLFDSLVLVQPPSEQLDANIWHVIDEHGGMGLPLVLEICPQDFQTSIIVHSLPHRTRNVDMLKLLRLFEKTVRSILDSPTADAEDIHAFGFPGLQAALKCEAVYNDINSLEQHQESEQQWTDSELLVRDVMSSLANVDTHKISRTTSIYQLGLDSLNAAQIAAKLRVKGIDIDLADVLEQRTPAGIAKQVRTRVFMDKHSLTDRLADFDKKNRELVEQHTQLRSHDIESVRPCTAVQQGMIAQSIASEGYLYVNHVWTHTQGTLSLNIVKAAWEKVQRRHPILRTSFLSSNSMDSHFFMFTRVSRSSEMAANQISEGVLEDLEARVSAEIVRSLHVCPWRVHLGSHGSNTVMVLSIHHALYDAAGLDVLLADFECALQNHELEPSYDLDRVLVPILAAIEESKPNGKKFWHDALHDASITAFPSLTPVLIKDFAIDEVEHVCGLSSVDLEQLCSRQKCTVQAAMQSSWARLLSDYLGENSVTFGTILSSRSTADDANIVFPSINTVPINVDVQGGDLLGRMVNLNAAVQRHRSTPLSDIQRFAGRPGQALFDTVVVYQRSNGTVSGQHLLTIERQSAAVDYKLSLELQSTPSGCITLRLSFASSILTKEHAILMLQQYEHIMLQELGQIQRPRPELLSITAPKQYIIDSDFALLHQTVEISASRHPDQTALDFVWSMDDMSKSSSKYSYAELDRLGNQVARLLVGHGVNKTDIIAVCMSKCPEASFAFLGILKAGCAFLALDPDLPKARKEFILKDSSAKVLLTGADIHIEGLDTQSSIIRLSQSVIQEYSDKPVEVGAIDPQSTCYCLYTSGTTGTPKGCEISHESAVQAMMSFQRLFAGHWTQSSRWLQFASYWFDVSVLEHFWSWSVGITMVGAPRDLVLGDLVEFINRAHVTHIDLTPSLARLLDPEDVPCLCHGVFITGGEALKQEIIQRWGSHAVICNGYGPTEATIGVTMNTFIDASAKATNIGPAFDNVGSCVVDPETLQPVYTGSIGELCVYGKLVGKGYLNRPDLTAKAFPILESINERVYRTGDLVRQLADGSFLFVGRKDSQAKLRGQRLEIDEIDSIIKASHTTIADVASLVVKSADGNKQTLISFITAIENQRNDRSAIELQSDLSPIVGQTLKACRKFLPGYMVPTHILPISKIPLTVNNKTDAKALTTFYMELPVKDIQALQGSVESQRSLSKEGVQISEVIADLLSIKREDINNSSNIFSLGLSSVSAISLANHLKRKGFDKANVAIIMRNPQIENLVSALSDGTADEEDSNIQQAKLSMASFDQRNRRRAAQQLGLDPISIEKVVQCTPLQEGLLFESMRSQHRPYFNTFRLTVHDGTDLERIQTSINTLAANVEILRASFLESDEGYLQVITKQQQWSVKFLHREPKEPLEEVLTRLASEWHQDNERDVPVPFQPSLLRSTNGSLLVLQIHHALYDGISFDRLMTLLRQIYENKKPDYGPSYTSILPYGPMRKVTAAKEFWTHAMDGLTFSAFPVKADVSNPHSTVTIKRTLSYAGLEQTRQILGTSHQSLIQAAFQVSLCQYSAASSSYGLITSGRTIAIEGADRALGPLFNTLPVRIALTQDLTWKQLVLECSHWATSLLPHQHTALRDIKKWSGRQANEDLFDVLFVLQLADDTASITNDLWTLVHEEPYAEYALAFEVLLHENGRLEISLVSKASSTNEVDLLSIVTGFDTALSQIVNRHESAISQTFDLDWHQHKDAPMTIEPMPANVNGFHNFAWSDKAVVLRQELASLAGLDEFEVNEHATIYELGLDSIDAVKLASRLRKRKVDLKVSTILQSQTIPRMLATISEQPISDTTMDADLVRTLQNDLEAQIELPQSTSKAIEQILPATPGQEALLAAMVQSELRNYFNHDLLKIAKTTNIEQLQRAWEIVVRESPVLRTSFIPVDLPGVRCTFVQVVHCSQGIDFERAKLQSSEELPALIEAIREDVLATMDHRPPIRLTIVTIDRAEHLLLSLAHAQYDGHSLALLHSDVADAYNQAYQARPSPYSAINTALLAAESASIDFWVNELTDLRIGSFRSLHAGGQEVLVNRYEITSKIQYDQARQICRKLGISMQTLAQTCWSLVLAAYTQRLEVLFGAVLACRDSEMAEKIMFPTMNTVPVRASLSGSRKDMLLALQKSNGDMQAHKQTPLRMIHAAYRAKQDNHMSSPDLFDSLFIYQQTPGPRHGQTTALYQSTASASSVDYHVAAEMEISGTSIIFRAGVRDNILTQSQTTTLVQQMDQVFQEIISAPGKPTVDLDDKQISICGLPAFAYDALESSTSISDRETDQNEEECTAPDKVVDRVSNVLAQVSGIASEDISRASSLDALGIDSISAIKVSLLLKKAGMKIRIGDMLKARSVGRIAALVAHADRQQPSSNVIRRVDISLLSRDDLPTDLVINKDEIEDIQPALAGQIYMLSVWSNTRGRLFYPTFTYELFGHITESQIHKAWTALVAYHPILRTVFVATTKSEFPVAQVVLKKPPGTFVDEAAATLIQTEQPFARLHAVATRSGWTLRLTIHHALYDAVSLELLIQDLRRLIKQEELQRPPIKSKDYIAHIFEPQIKTRCRDFWSSYLSQTSTTRLQNIRTQSCGRRVEIFKPNVLPDALTFQRRARKESLSIQSILFAAWAKIYAASCTSKEHDVVLGIYMSNRSHLDGLLELRQPTLNLLPLLVRQPFSISLLQLARQVQQDLAKIGSIEHSSVALWEVTEWTGIEIDCFLNFVKLPDSDDTRQSEHEIDIRGLDTDRELERSQVVDIADNHEFSLPSELQKMPAWRQAYQDTLDIEMTVAHGSLDVGIFALESIVSLEGAQGMLSSLKDELTSSMSLLAG